MTDLNIINESKYIKPAREIKVFRGISIAFIFVLFVMPQYFGIPLPIFDFTVLRIMIVFLSLIIFSDKKRSDDFIDLIKTSAFIYVLFPYLIVITYTMVFRADINAFLNPFIELYSLCLMVYVIHYSLGVKSTIKLLVFCSYLLTILGLVEFAMGRTPFVYLITIRGIYTGGFVRSGNYRIMSSAIHSLGYGLVLLTMIPLAFYNEDTDKVDPTRHTLLTILIVINVFLTGSRSTLGVLILEIVLALFLVDKEVRRKFLLGTVVFLIVFSAIVAVFHNTGFGRYMLLQITSVIDSVFGTTYSVQYGADLSSLGSSTNYREQLKGIFKVKWLNPILGIGRKRAFSGMVNGSYVKSVDNYYICEYIRYAYPGMITYMGFLAYWILKMIKEGFGKLKSDLSKILLVGVVCYALNLKWVDSLQTLKYLYILFALNVCSVDKKQIKPKIINSKYIKKSYR